MATDLKETLNMATDLASVIDDILGNKPSTKQLLACARNIRLAYAELYIANRQILTHDLAELYIANRQILAHDLAELIRGCNEEAFDANDYLPGLDQHYPQVDASREAVHIRNAAWHLRKTIELLDEAGEADLALACRYVVADLALACRDVVAEIDRDTTAGWTSYCVIL